MEETLFFNGAVRAMDGSLCGELLVRDGRVAALGQKGELPAACGGAQRVDLGGAALLPGFIDGHSHLTQLAGALRAVPLGGCRTLGAVAEALRPAAASGTGWIVGFGYDHNLLAEGRHPDAALLDRVSADRPVLVSHQSGHMGVLNSAALRLLHITADTPDPEGGRIARLPDGAPAGLLEETAFMRASAQVPPPTDAELDALLRQAQEVYLSHGLTTIQDGLLDTRGFDLLSRAAARGDLKADVVGYADLKNCPRLLSAHPECRRYKNRFRIGGYKIFLDGSPQGRTAWLSQPYLPQEGQPDDWRGYPVYRDEEVRAFVRRAEADETQLLAHCNGDAAAQQFLDAFSRPTVHRDVLIHAQTLRRDQLPRVWALGLMPSYFVAHVRHWGDAHLRNLGPARAAAISPLASTARWGIPFTLHQDTPVLPPDPLECLSCAVNRRTASGALLGPEERVDAETALRALTVWGAYQYAEEKEKGALRPGMRADLVLLSGDPVQTAPEALDGLRVLATYKDGVCVWDGRK